MLSISPVSFKGQLYRMPNNNSQERQKTLQAQKIAQNAINQGLGAETLSELNRIMNMNAASSELNMKIPDKYSKLIDTSKQHDLEEIKKSEKLAKIAIALVDVFQYCDDKHPEAVIDGIRYKFLYKDDMGIQALQFQTMDESSDIGNATLFDNKLVCSNYDTKGRYISTVILDNKLQSSIITSEDKKYNLEYYFNEKEDLDYVKLHAIDDDEYQNAFIKFGERDNADYIFLGNPRLDERTGEVIADRLYKKSMSGDFERMY